MINSFILRMAEVPGAYCIASFSMLFEVRMYFVEVDETLKVYKINLKTGERDGELTPAGWRGDEIAMDLRTIDMQGLPLKLAEAVKKVRGF